LEKELLNILEYKIINLKLINYDYIQYINDLSNFFEQYKNECNKLKIIPPDEETKLLYSVNELDKIDINHHQFIITKILRIILKN